MKKRLRKKLHLGEFKEYGFHVYVRFGSFDRSDMDSFLNSLLRFVENYKPYGASMGGGVNQFFTYLDKQHLFPLNERKERTSTY